MSSRGGWDFGNLLTEFSESGYSLWWQVLNAKDFGVPQNRERVFVIGFREGNPTEVFFEPENSRPTEIMGTTKGEENTRIGERDTVYGTGGVIGSLKATDYKQPPQILVQNKGESQHYRLYNTDGLAPTLQSQSGMSSQKHPFIFAERDRPEVLTPKRTEYGKKIRKDYEAGNIKEQRKNIQQLEPRTDGISNTLTGVEKDNYVFDGQVRKLMPIECERLMSWKDDWTKFGRTEKGEVIEISDSQRYRMCGNGVVSNVIKILIEKLIV